jgi:uncharacterized membrane protein YoaK (UPF0700 family)
MTEKKRNTLYWLWKIAGIIIACGLPIWAICEKFPLWSQEVGEEKTIGAGIILIAIVVLIVFRKTVFDFIRDKLDLKHAPPLVIWLVLLIISYTILYLGTLMKDLTTVFWLGFIGSAVGTVFTYISDRYKPTKEGSK